MSEPASQQQKQQVQIKADEKELLGQYSNLVVDPSQPRGIHTQFYIYVPHRAAGKARREHDRESPRTRSG